MAGSSRCRCRGEEAKVFRINVRRVSKQKRPFGGLSRQLLSLSNSHGSLSDFLQQREKSASSCVAEKLPKITDEREEGAENHSHTSRQCETPERRTQGKTDTSRVSHTRTPPPPPPPLTTTTTTTTTGPPSARESAAKYSALRACLHRFFLSACTRARVCVCVTSPLKEIWATAWVGEKLSLSMYVRTKYNYLPSPPLRSSQRTQLHETNF